MRNADLQIFFRPRLVFGLLGIVLAIVVFLLLSGGLYPKAPLMAAVVVLMAVWWVFEVVPIPVTSLFPLFLLPLFGIADVSYVGAFYGRPIIFLFLGGFMLALGLQASGIHKRIALRITMLIGSRPRSLVLGFMISSGFLSMWISNTASVMVMLPIALAILAELPQEVLSDKDLERFGICFMLGIAYAADIGGMATPIGTPPNLIFLEMYGQLFPDAPAISFLDWMLMGLPLSFLFMWFGWFLLTRFIFRMPPTNFFEGKEGIKTYLDALGPVRRDEYFSGLVFLFTALLWIGGSDIEFGEHFTIYGWRTLFGLEQVSDAAVAVAGASLLFLIPSKDRQGEALLTWESARKIPWGILLLFGAGFAIAGGFEISELSKVVSHVFAALPAVSPLLVIALICIFITFLTELTSNTALTNLMLPILASAAVVMEIDPRLMLIPATLSASCAFMMPIASPTQAIVFGSGYVPIRQMVRAGIWFNLLGIVLVILIFYLIGSVVLGVDFSGAPEWSG